jgi:hypothetical protein
MKKYLPLFILIPVISCKSKSGADRDYDKFDPAKTYTLRLNPLPGSSYHYDITSETETKLEVDGKKTGTESKSTAGVIFKMDKDSTGDFLLNMQYDKLHIYSKSGDIETDADAANSANSLNPVERMLGMLKEAKIITTIGADGNTKNISGYKELGDKIIAGFASNDANGKAIAENMWEKQIGNGMVKNNINQLFKIFPDSAVHLKDKWQLTSKQEAEVGLLVKSEFTLKAINNDVAVIAIEGKITSDNAAGNIMGMNNVTTDLQGDQEGEFEMDRKTGMLISSTVKAKVNGTISVMGRVVPVVIKTSVTIDGRKL